MTVRKLNSTGDIATNGVQFLSGVEEVAQTIATRLRLFLGEYFRDITDGTPWFQNILTKDGTLEGTDAIIKRRMLQTPNVTQVLTYNADYDIASRTYTITAQILTTFGELAFRTEEGF